MAGIPQIFVCPLAKFTVNAILTMLITTIMENYEWNNYKIAECGNWDYDYGYGYCYGKDDVPYTQRFDGARQPGFLPQDRDLYQNDVVTPAFILLPRSSTMKRKREIGYPNVKEDGKTEQGKMMQKPMQEWEGYSYAIKTKIPPARIDQDLYKIPSEFLHVKPKKKGSGLGLFSSCFLLPACV